MIVADKRPDLVFADSIPGAPHPRQTHRLFGQAAAEQAFLTALNSDRLHHGWLITGPRGVGKATLAWRIARHLIANPPGQEAGLFGAPPVVGSLDLPQDHPVTVRMAALSDPGLALIRRSHNDKGVLRKDIVIDDVRALSRFFGMSAADGGHRVVIVDAADDMNTSAANGLLKMLEEPPSNCTLLLVAHQPSRLLPTIRSRCRMLRLSPLTPADMQTALAQTGADLPADTTALSALADGSVGAALRLINLGGLELYQQITGILTALPRIDRPRVLALGEVAAARGETDRFELMLTLFDKAMARLARTGATGLPPQPEAALGEAHAMARLAPDAYSARAWADRAAEVNARARHGLAVNLDPAALVLDTVLKMQEAARA